MLFFELRVRDRGDLVSLDDIRELSVNRPFYGAVILRGEDRDPDSTALIKQTVSDQPIAPLYAEAGLLAGTALSASVDIAGQHCGAMLMWSDINFSAFAFDLLALLKGTYRPGYASSLHGLDLTAWKLKA
jgi:hypothetical protein